MEKWTQLITMQNTDVRGLCQELCCFYLKYQYFVFGIHVFTVLMSPLIFCVEWDPGDCDHRRGLSVYLPALPPGSGPLPGLHPQNLQSDEQ